MTDDAVVPPEPDLSKYGPWAVIAGGSEGVGAEFARQLARGGVNVVLVARKPGPLTEVAESCRALGVEVRTLAVDLVDGGVEAIIEATEDLEVGLLVCNAGANTHSMEFLDGDPREFQRVIDLNLTATLALVRHYGRLMRDRQRGGILLVGSLSEYAGSIRHTIYGGVKAFVRIFGEGLWLELRDYGVDVLTLVLGVTRTPAMERVGLNFDAPGMVVSEPADVAREGLAHLAHGPVHVVTGNEKSVAWRTGPDRTKIVLTTHKAMTGLMNGEQSAEAARHG
ncbi:SDR family NAD(P)-dependent oxidoreductase [Nocardia sp. CA2R105]|uniref:SDR family NAD(P)-dependent oxidoreductase n=1 Tax=Nocardia coffeae TaxID=2873381 RepID=UPI001CA738D1|nr:SDR family NAD(P)-dependent oxidoreductase [Nocardia coffeae]MBY8857012.1 SDR family NAD(P)-dependent oxidoreductase [Nocardia coffeae]